MVAEGSRPAPATKSPPGGQNQHTNPPSFSSRFSPPTLQVADWEPKIRSIVAWFDQLQAVDVDGVDPFVGGDTGADFVTRPDAVTPFDADAALADAPEREGGFIKVPKIM